MIEGSIELCRGAGKKKYIYDILYIPYNMIHMICNTNDIRNIRVDIDDRGSIELCRVAGKKKYIYDKLFR